MVNNVNLIGEELDVQPVGGWGDDDLGLDDEEGGAKADKDEIGEEGDGWDNEDDLELPPDAELPAAVSDEGFFVAPTKGTPVPLQWTNMSKLVVDHILAGSFESAGRLLNEQVGVVEIGPFKPLFLSTYTRARASYTALPNMPSLYLYPLRNWKDQKAPLPAIGLHIADLIARLQVCIKLQNNCCYYCYCNVTYYVYTPNYLSHFRAATN